LPPRLAAVCPGGYTTNYTVSTRVATNHPNDWVVTDNATGLMWKECPEASGQTAGNGTCSNEAVAMTWADAVAAANGSSYAGYSDWHLSNINELRSLVDRGCFNPAINDSKFPQLGQGSYNYYYWSSTTYGLHSDKAWYVYFNYDGETQAVDKVSARSVRLVRGPQSLDNFDSTKPVATTNAASSITATDATLNGTASDGGAATTAEFEYGTTASYGSSVAAAPATIAGSTAVSATLVGLTCGMTYHFRLDATNNAGTSNGADQTFTTVICNDVIFRDDFETH
jgi:hypothetical protein